jgi:hypothetical protein
LQKKKKKTHKKTAKKLQRNQADPKKKKTFLSAPHGCMPGLCPDPLLIFFAKKKEKEITLALS